MKCLLIAALAVVSLAACGGPLDGAPTTAHAVSALELSVPVPVTPAPMVRADIVDIVEVTDIVVTPRDRLEQLRTGQASFERAHITSDFQRGASGGCH